MPSYFFAKRENRCIISGSRDERPIFLVLCVIFLIQNLIFYKIYAILKRKKVEYYAEIKIAVGVIFLYAQNRFIHFRRGVRYDKPVRK